MLGNEEHIVIANTGPYIVNFDKCPKGHDLDYWTGCPKAYIAMGFGADAGAICEKPP